MYRMWKSLFIVATILLVSCTLFCVSFWHQLNVTKIRLAYAEARLADTVAELNTTRTQLSVTENQLATTEAQLSFTKNRLAFTEAQLDTTRSQLETAKNENSQMLNQYAGLKRQINVRLGDTRQDRQSFITPDNSAVSAKVREVTGGYSEDVSGYWWDCEQLYRWVVNNIRYSYDSRLPYLPETLSGELTWSKDYWRMPEETLEDKTGDCEDMAVLLASMLRSYNEGKYSMGWVLGIESNVPEEKRHLAVAFPVKGGRLTILDPAGNYYTGYKYGSLGSDITSAAVSDWLSYWEKDMPGVKIVEAFSEDSYDEFSSTDEFLTWQKQ